MERFICNTCDNEQCFINKYCSPEWHSLITKHKTCIIYKKGNNIFNKGAYVAGILFIYSGKVKVFNSDMNGKKQILRLSKAGDILGFSEMGGNEYSVSAVAIEDSKICFIPNDIFLQALKANPKLVYNIMMFCKEELSKVELRLIKMAHMNTKKRVADALLFIKDAYGLDDSLALHPALTRQDIADIAGTSHTEAIRVLSRFKNKKIIATKGKTIKILNEQELKEIANINTKNQKNITVNYKQNT